MAYVGMLIASVILPWAISTGDSATDTAIDRFTSDLENAGYTVHVDARTVDYAGLSVEGTPITADKHGATAEFELLSYPSREAMSRDWKVADNEPPNPQQPVRELEDRALHWHGTNILIVDYDASSDAGTAWIAALVFLGLKNISPDGLPIGTVPKELIGAGGPSK